MPKTTVSLTDKEVRQACAYWVECDCPTPKGTLSVYLQAHAGSNDPREPSGTTVTAQVEINQPK